MSQIYFSSNTTRLSMFSSNDSVDSRIYNQN